MTADRTVDAWLDDAFAERTGGRDAGDRTGTRSEFVDRWERFAADAADGAAGADCGPRVPDTGSGRAVREPVDLAVVEQDLPGHLFGFTRRDSDHVTVNRALYRVDRESTVSHEKMHHRSPKDELTIRYLNGDLDVENTLSFRANRAGRVGSGRGRVPPRAAARTAYGPADAAYDR